MADFLYDAHGEPVGFIHGRFIHDMHGHAVGQMDGTHVYKISGAYVGELHMEMVVNKHLGKAGIGRPATPSNAAPPAHPGKRGPRNHGFRDVFAELLK